jgi:hypothetical protein
MSNMKLLQGIAFALAIMSPGAGIAPAEAKGSNAAGAAPSDVSPPSGMLKLVAMPQQAGARGLVYFNKGSTTTFEFVVTGWVLMVYPQNQPTPMGPSAGMWQRFDFECTKQSLILTHRAVVGSNGAVLMTARMAPPQKSVAAAGSIEAGLMKAACNPAPAVTVASTAAAIDLARNPLPAAANSAQAGTVMPASKRECAIVYDAMSQAHSHRSIMFKLNRGKPGDIAAAEAAKVAFRERADATSQAFGVNERFTLSYAMVSAYAKAPGALDGPQKSAELARLKARVEACDRSLGLRPITF